MATAMKERESAWNGEDQRLVRGRRPLLEEIVERKRERERDIRDRRPFIPLQRRE